MSTRGVAAGKGSMGPTLVAAWAVWETGDRWPSQRGGGERDSSGSNDSTTQCAFTLGQADAKGSVCIISVSDPTNPMESVQPSQPFYKEFKDL